MEGAAAGDEDTEPEPEAVAAPPGGATAELLDAEEHAEQTAARTPTAAASVPFLIAIAPVYSAQCR